MHYHHQVSGWYSHCEVGGGCIIIVSWVADAYSSSDRWKVCNHHQMDGGCIIIIWDSD